MILRLFLMLVLVAIVGAGIAAADYFAFLKKELTIPDAPATFTIESGWSGKRVSRELVNRNILDKPWWLDAYARIEGVAGSIKSGQYILNDGMTPPELMALFQTGQTQEYPFTIIEGSTFKQLLTKLSSADRLQHGDNPIDTEVLMASLGKQGIHPEGQFFADTYLSPDGTDATEVLARASALLDSVLAEEWENRQPELPLANAYEALILASIVEKETAVAAERPLIAGVFLSRLIKKMRLQTDPTVIYGMGDSFDGNIRRKDLQTDTPYNTYTRGGLPPTPIALVGREAIHAVLHPEDTDALYFVSRGDGTHQFSRTLEEHNAAVRKYQLNKR